MQSIVNYGNITPKDPVLMQIVSTSKEGYTGGSKLDMLSEESRGRLMAVKVFFIAKIKDFNDEYKDYVQRVRELGESDPRFISLENEEIGDIEITITTWRSKEDVADWAKDPRL